MIIPTHSARVHQLDTPPAGSPELRRGMPIARCGWSEPDVAVAWKREYVTCPMCIAELDGISYTPGLGADVHDTSAFFGFGEELPVRTPRRPDYVPQGAVYHPIEFADEHPRGRRVLNLFQSIALWILILAATATVVAVVAWWSHDAGPRELVPAYTTVAPTPTPDPPDQRHTSWSK